MRKRRVLIFNEDPRLRNELELFFQVRNYETMIFREPEICPVYGSVQECRGPYSCGDIVIMSYTTPGMNGIDLLLAQQKNGCKLSSSNKAIVAGTMPELERARLGALGSALFLTPLDFKALEKWARDRADLMDLDRPVAIRRREERHASPDMQVSVAFSEDRMHSVTVVNKSACGICFRASHSPMKNQIVTLHAGSAGRTEDGVVRWVNRTEDGTFLVGLSLCL